MSHEARTLLKEERQLVLIQNLTDLFFPKFSSQFIFPALGHEDFHSRKNLTDVWSRWLPMDSMSTFEKGKLAHCFQLIKLLHVALQAVLILILFSVRAFPVPIITVIQKHEYTQTFSRKTC